MSSRAEPAPRDEPEPPGPEEDDGEDREPADRVYAPVLAVVLAWYLFPGLLFLVWTMLFGGGPAASTCGPGLPGCEPGTGPDPRPALVGTLPWLGLAVLSSLVAAVLLRLMALTWRAVNVGTAAAIIGAGMSTLLFELIT